MLLLPNLTRTLVLLLVCLGLALMLAGCGKKAKLRHPDGSSYPREYPTR